MADDILHTHTTDIDGNPLVVRALKGSYLTNGAPGIVLWQCDEKGLLTFEEPWCRATVNGVGPVQPGLVTLDVNNMERALTDDLMAWGHITDTGLTASSGWCTYPICLVDQVWYDSLASVDDVDGPDGARYFAPEFLAEWA